MTKAEARIIAAKARCNTIEENLLSDADRICAIIDLMIYERRLDARSPLADERLCYGEPLPLEVAKALLQNNDEG